MLHVAKREQTWEGGYASRPGVIEAQGQPSPFVRAFLTSSGGTTYCSVASISLISKPPLPPSLRADDTIRWICQRQLGGFQGRPGKVEDVCYSFWCGAALRVRPCSSAWGSQSDEQILGEDLVDHEADTAFLLSAQSPLGGFGKEPEDYPDPYHSYLALAALALTPDAQAVGIKPLDPLWNVSLETRAWLEAEQVRLGWRT